MGVENLVTGLAIAFLQLVLGLVFAMGSVYLGLRMFDKLTEGIDEMKELKRGNVAVAILLGAIIFSIANIVEGGVSALISTIGPGLTGVQIAAGLVIGVVNLLIGLILAVFSIYLAINNKIPANNAPGSTQPSSAVIHFDSIFVTKSRIESSSGIWISFSCTKALTNLRYCLLKALNARVSSTRSTGLSTSN